MDYSIRGRVRPKLEPNEAKVKKEGYGWRKSVHRGWMHALPNEHVFPDDWPVEISMFFEKLVSGSSTKRIKVYTASHTGEIVDECSFDPAKSYAVEEKLADLMNQELNLLFDPVPWQHGKRSKKTRLGFGTVTNGHPFDYFPEPCMFWAVGVRAFQFLVPWHEPTKIGESIETLRNAGLTFDYRFQPLKDDLLVLPGSVIYAPMLPPFTAEVLFDAFSTTEVEDHNALWSKY